jgi:hypothetical protein
MLLGVPASAGMTSSTREDGAKLALVLKPRATTALSVKQKLTPH